VLFAAGEVTSNIIAYSPLLLRYSATVDAFPRKCGGRARYGWVK
jgi:hypothetical protein